MSESPTPQRQATALYAGLGGLVVAVWLAILPIRPLFNPDEGRYAEIPREMLRDGDWIIPHLNGLAYVEKPPLQYWATALSLAVFGKTVFGARIYTTLCALLTLGSVWWIADRMWDRASAWRASFALGGMGLFVILGQLLTLDMSLTGYLTLALAGFLAAQRSPHPRRGMLLAWTAIGLGVLTKGLVAAVIPAAALIIYSLLSRDVGPWRRLHVNWGLPLFLTVTVPWHWLAARRQPDFLEFFFVHEHVARYLTPSADRQEPWWFFAVVFLAGSLPWSISALRILVTGWQRGGVPDDAVAPSAAAFDPRRFLWVWVAFIGVFFSLSDSKLIPYIAPILPALALLLATGSADSRRWDVIWSAALSVLAAMLLFVVCFEAPRMLADTARNAQFLTLATPLLQIAAGLCVTGALALVAGKRDTTRGMVLLGSGWCVATLLAMRAATAVAGIYSGVTLVPALAQIPPAAPLYSVGMYDQTLSFYLQRTVTLVSYRGELAFGLDHSADIVSLSLQAFLDRWKDARPAYAIMEMDMFERLSTEGLPMREIARDSRQIVVSRQ